jgi:hypothetical protein
MLGSATDLEKSSSRELLIGEISDQNLLIEPSQQFLVKLTHRYGTPSSGLSSKCATAKGFDATLLTVRPSSSISDGSGEKMEPAPSRSQR